MLDFGTRARVIQYRTMDITTVTRGIVAHGVNCQRKMGSGVAKAIRKKWPMVYDWYLKYEPVLGRVDIIPVATELYVANCYTQHHYGYDNKAYANLAAIGACLLTVAGHARAWSYPVYMPKIGCGLGGLSWKDVEPLLLAVDHEFADLPITVCEFGGEQ